MVTDHKNFFQEIEKKLLTVFKKFVIINYKIKENNKIQVNRTYRKKIKKLKKVVDKSYKKCYNKL